MVQYLVFGVLQVAALARFADTPDWDGAAAWLYVAFLLSVLGVAAWGVRRAAPRAAEEPGATRTAAPVV